MHFSNDTVAPQLYLDSVTADVRFVSVDGTGSVMAHKCILAKASKTFHELFYGSSKKIDEFPIELASADAFKEFLQFCYKNEATLTSKNIIDVLHLCGIAGLERRLAGCQSSIAQLMSIENMCAGYEWSVMFKLSEMEEYCSHQIQSNAREICLTKSFLECSPSTFSCVIATLCASTLPNYNASMILNACMDWAKAECTRWDLAQTSYNLKMQLVNCDAFHLMPFGNLEADEFGAFTAKYQKFLGSDDLESIIGNLLTKQSIKKRRIN